MRIRQGTKEDAEQLTTLLLLAMEDIVFRFIGTTDREQAYNFLFQLVQQQGNQYAYDQHWVIDDDVAVRATALVYDGAKLYELRAPVANLVKTNFNLPFNPEGETQAGEFYIDCLAVDPSQQGKGLGSKLIQFLKEEYVDRRKTILGLLVDEDNPSAKKLYERLGFHVVGSKSLLGKKLDHMQFGHV